MPDHGSERIGVLVIRAWRSREQCELIARITGKLDLEKPAKTSQTAAGVEAATRAAVEWLLDFEQACQQDRQDR
jgi:hypothetical protein